MAEDTKNVVTTPNAEGHHLDKRDVTRAWFKWVCLSNTNYNY